MTIDINNYIYYTIIDMILTYMKMGSLLLASIFMTVKSTCFNAGTLKMCTDTNRCPDSYHMCNVYDRDTILESEVFFDNITDTFSLNIADDTCQTCDVNPYSNVLEITPYNNDVINNVIHKKGCNIENEFIKLGDVKIVDTCIACKCESKQTVCTDICKYGSVVPELSTFKNSNSNCLGLYKSGKNGLKCHSIHSSKNIACCKDNQCKLRHCKSCERYGNIEICNECEKDFYFNIYSKNKCHSKTLIYSICNGLYTIDEKKKSFQCLDCYNGIIERHNNTMISDTCICNEGYFGNMCQYRYDEIYCSNNGIYDIDNKYCICDTEYYGTNCESNILFSCVHGKYNSNTKSCICDVGFKGDNCNEVINCKRGHLINNICICEEGFSGNDCSIYISETQLQREAKNKYLEEYYTRRCKHGTLYRDDVKNDICVCNAGFSGYDCGEPICKHGTYNITTSKCHCNSGYYGDRCQESCGIMCHYNGDFCKTGNSCVCNNGWSGLKCDTLELQTYNISVKNRVNIADSMDVQYNADTTHVNNLKFEIVPIRPLNSLPFRVLVNNHRQRELYTQRNSSCESGCNVQDLVNLTINDISLPINHSYYIYPNNDYNLSYFSGSAINIHTYGMSYIYIEQIREHDIIPTIQLNITHIGNNTERNSTSDDSYINVSNDIEQSIYFIATCGFIVIISLLCCMRCCHKYSLCNSCGKKQESHIRNSYNNDKLIMNRNPMARKTRIVNTSNIVPTQRNKVKISFRNHKPGTIENV